MSRARVCDWCGKAWHRTCSREDMSAPALRTPATPALLALLAETKRMLVADVAPVSSADLAAKVEELRAQLPAGGIRTLPNEPGVLFRALIRNVDVIREKESEALRQAKIASKNRGKT